MFRHGLVELLVVDVQISDMIVKRYRGTRGSWRRVVIDDA